MLTFQTSDVETLKQENEKLRHEIEILSNEIEDAQRNNNPG